MPLKNRFYNCSSKSCAQIPCQHFRSYYTCPGMSGTKQVGRHNWLQSCYTFVPYFLKHCFTSLGNGLSSYFLLYVTRQGLHIETLQSTTFLKKTKPLSNLPKSLLKCCNKYRFDLQNRYLIQFRLYLGLLRLVRNDSVNGKGLCSHNLCY